MNARSSHRFKVGQEVALLCEQRTNKFLGAAFKGQAFGQNSPGTHADAFQATVSIEIEIKARASPGNANVKTVPELGVRRLEVELYRAPNGGNMVLQFDSSQRELTDAPVQTGNRSLESVSASVGDSTDVPCAIGHPDPEPWSRGIELRAAGRRVFGIKRAAGIGQKHASD